MAPPKIFLTGGTGYIGGSVLHTIATAHPEYDITVLLRRIPDTFRSTYPNIRIVPGDYDSADVLAQEAAKADVVVHNGDSDHLPSLRALITGHLTRPTTSPTPPPYLIHLSGTAIISDWQTPPQNLGTLSPKIWSDERDVPAIASLPDTALHRGTEKLLFETMAAHAGRINIAIVCPPDIYGRGFGLGKTRSVFVPMFVGDILKMGRAKGKGRAFCYNEGTNTRSWVHIGDLAGLYLRIVEAGVGGGGGMEWNEKGYYFAGTQEHSQMEVARGVGAVLKKLGVVEEEEPVRVGLEEVDGMVVHPLSRYLGRYLYAANARSKAERAGRLVWYGEWKGRPGLLECLEGDVLEALGRVSE